MTNTAYHESYGERPVALLSAIKKFNVSPADFQTMEYMDMSDDEMLDFINRHSHKGYFNSGSLLGW